MRITSEQHRRFGNTGLGVPPILFGSAALANARRVIPDQTKLEICGEWLRQVAPPVFIDVSSASGNGTAPQVLGRVLRRLDIRPHEAVITARLGWDGQHPSSRALHASWEATCRRLDGKYRPQLVALELPGEYLSAARSPAERERHLSDAFDACHALAELKAAGKLTGIGLAVNDWRTAQELAAVLQLDWIMLIGSLTLLRHPAELLQLMAGLAERKIAVVLSSVFHDGFLVGGSQFDGRTMDAGNAEDQALFAWRKSFVALCHGHGISPAHACIQFALSAPGVVAVAVETSYPDRVAENAQSAVTEVPAAFWTAMKEERLLAEDYPHLG